MRRSTGEAAVAKRGRIISEEAEAATRDQGQLPLIRAWQALAQTWMDTQKLREGQRTIGGDDRELALFLEILKGRVLDSLPAAVLNTMEGFGGK